MDGGNRQGWIAQVDGRTGDPGSDKVCVFRLDSPAIVFEVEAPGIRTLTGEAQVAAARRAVMDAVAALQKALATGSVLPAATRFKQRREPGEDCP